MIACPNATLTVAPSPRLHAAHCVSAVSVAGDGALPPGGAGEASGAAPILTDGDAGVGDAGFGPLAPVRPVGRGVGGNGRRGPARSGPQKGRQGDETGRMAHGADSTHEAPRKSQGGPR